MDFNRFQNAYSYADFLEDMVIRDQLLQDKERLERELAQAKKALEAQVSRAG